MGWRKQFINNFVFPALACTAGFNNNNYNNNNNYILPSIFDSAYVCSFVSLLKKYGMIKKTKKTSRYLRFL